MACTSVVSPSGSASLLSSSHVVAVSSCSRGGRPRSSRVCGHPAQVGVDEAVHLADLVAAGVDDRLEVERAADVHRGLDPVGQQVLVADEDPGAAGALAGRPLGVEQHVEPAGREVRGAELVGVVLLLAADDLGRGTQHRREDRGRAGPDRGHPPQAEEPAQPRVLDDQLGVDVEVRLEPLGDPDPGGLAGGDAAGLEPGAGPAVAHLDAGLLEEPVVQVDDPLRLAEATRVGRVGGDLGQRDVHAEQAGDAGHRGRAAAPGPGDEQHLAGHAVGIHLVDGAGLPLRRRVPMVVVRSVPLASVTVGEPTTRYCPHL